jgi:glycosyltransferase involved in cell wall biosynthesis
MQPALSVVIPCRNVETTLDAQLDALCSQPFEHTLEIIAVDNGSTDGTIELLRRRRAADPRINIVDASDGVGANFTRNVGMQHAAAQRVVFCDGDDVVGPRWLSAMYDALLAAECVTGPLDVQRLNPAWLVRTRGDFPADAPRAHCGVVPVVPGGNMGLQRTTWASVGGFRIDLDTAGEDVEFSLRLLQWGVPVTFAPDAVVYYRYRTEAGALWRQGRAYGRAKPWTYKLLRDAGLATPSRFAGWKSWFLVALWLPRLVTRDGRAAWCWVAGSRLGQLEGCRRHKVFWL